MNIEETLFKKNKKTSEQILEIGVILLKEKKYHFLLAKLLYSNVIINTGSVGVEGGEGRTFTEKIFILTICTVFTYPTKLTLQYCHINLTFGDVPLGLT